MELMAVLGQAECSAILARLTGRFYNEQETIGTVGDRCYCLYREHFCNRIGRSSKSTTHRSGLPLK
ncbi:hypothetical protein [Microcoleus sp. herbarium12]|uniref:hypothetical protein n=1 Tax=Microcoleus sp. herbarium12 TaxID=3055437 RepID=UPI002FD0D9E3